MDYYKNLSLQDLTDEVWKQIPKFENYYVSNFGRIKSIRKNIIIKQCFNKDYLVIGLTNNYGRSTVRVHRIVAICFLGNPINKQMEVNHKDGIKTNNSVGNLEWKTHKDNSIHMFLSGNRKMKVTPDIVRQIRIMYNHKNLLQTEIAKNLKLSVSCVNEIITGKKWWYIK